MVYRLLIVVLALAVAGCGGGGSGDGGSNIGVGARVPDVVGQTQANATTTITNAGLHVGNVTTANSSTVAVGNVVSQSPAAGTVVAPASNVDLVVSSGPAGPNPPFGMDVRPPVANFTLPNQGGGGGSFTLVQAFPNLPTFSEPLFLAPVPAPDTRLVVVEQTGAIRVFTPSAGVSAAGTILDLSPLITTNGNEQGLLGFAFDPDYPTNHFIYVNYTRAGDGATVVARYTWDGTNAVDTGTAKTILTVAQPAANHNGGMLAFGPDGYLYIAFGDGGGGDDQFNNGQNLGSLLAKILRIDVHPQNSADAYDVPPDNPFVGNPNARPEIWALGLRNPFRFSFDRQTGRLWVGDVGQNQYEEIDIVTRGGNYGWPAFEGAHVYLNVALAAGTTATAPVYEYAHSLGFAIIGGYVYRGSRFAALFGRYVYADYGSGTIWSIDENVQINATVTSGGSPTSFGEDNDGELYVIDRGGRLYQLQQNGGGGSQPMLLSQTGLFTGLPLTNPSPQTALVPASGLIEYDLNVPFWSDGALKRRWVAIPAGSNVGFSATGGWTFPSGTVLVKHFEMELTEGDPNSRRRLETRVLIRDSNGDWMGFTYKWNDAQTDADLLASGESETLTVQPTSGPSVTWAYSYPSRTDCLQCHTAAANRALGLVTRNMNRDFDYGAVTDNQLRTLNHIGYFTTNIGAATQYGAYPVLTDTNASVASRARAYLAVNCAQCHRPGGPTPVNLDFRFDTADTAMNAIGVVPTQGDLGIGASARIIAAGSKESSVLWHRIENLDSTRMPPLGSHRVDEAAVDLIGQWIDAM